MLTGSHSKEDAILNKPILFPAVLDPFRQSIESSITPFIKIRTKAGNPHVYDSKFGGYPYLPKTFAYPEDLNGHPMRLLAQYRLDQIPALPDMPTEGMLQFFISQDDVYGINFDNPTKPDHFRVIYHSTVTEDLDQLVNDFSFLSSLENDEESSFPIDQEYTLLFERTEEVVGLSDFRFERLPILFDEDKEEEIWETWESSFSNSGHKIGGYAAFTQTDPREDEEFEEFTTLLLQIDSEGNDGIMWGDMGVANFFIRPEDLKKRDFSRVLYNWDCC